MNAPEIKININGKALPTFTNFTLNQTMFGHHSFTLVVGHDVVEELGSHVLNNSKEWIGKPFISTFGENEFNGIVTSVKMAHFHGMYGDLIVEGYSPTILLEAGPHNHSWNEKGLKDIVQETIDAAGIDSEVKPEYTAKENYIAQYRETHFAFLNRLAATYHENFYYDGKVLNFGPLSKDKAVEVVYGQDLDNIEISLRIAPIVSEGFSYNSGNDEHISSSTPGSTAFNGLGKHAYDTSKSSFSIAPNGTLLPRIGDKGRLDEVLKKREDASGANLNWISGTGKKMDLKPGAKIDIQALAKENGSWNAKPYGEFRIISVQHSCTGNFEYSNRFEAIPADLDTLPSPAVTLPVAEPQIAIVKDNADPKKKGRVQVQLLWQQGTNMTSPWLRVMTPDGGASDNVGTNRGFVFVPEIGDYVMVGFRYNDPQRPFVMGAMFNGSTAAGGSDNNKTKSITTRSGVTITIDDDNGDGSITISDPSGNSIALNGDKTMNITAPDEMTLSSKKINILGDEEVNIDGGQKVNITSLEITETGKTKVTISSDATVEIGSKSTSIAGDMSMKMEGMNVDISGSVATNVKGMMLNLN